MKSPQLVCWIIYVDPFVGFGLWQQPDPVSQCPSLPRWIDIVILSHSSHLFHRRGASRVGLEGGGAHSSAGLIVLLCQSILLIFICLGLCLAVYWITMFRKPPPGAVNQLNIELNAKKMFCLTHWRWKQASSCDRLFIDNTQEKHISGLVNFRNINETPVSRCIFMSYIFLNLNRKLLARIDIASVFTWKQGNLQHFFKDLCAILSLILQYKVPLRLHQIRIRHETFSLFWGKFPKILLH